MVNFANNNLITDQYMFACNVMKFRIRNKLETFKSIFVIVVHDELSDIPLLNLVVHYLSYRLIFNGVVLF